MTFEGSQEGLVEYLRKLRDDKRHDASNSISHATKARRLGEADGLESACHVIENWTKTDG